MSVVISGAAASPAVALPITLTATDAANTTSFNSAGHWSNSAPPAPGNSYSTGAFALRTPTLNASGDMGTFLGDSLSIDAGGRFLGKAIGGTTAATITINNLILNGGAFDEAGAADTAVLTVNGNITVAAASTIGALGAAANNSTLFETLSINATISGSADLTVGGAQNAGADTGIVRLNVANPYSGNITVATPTNGFIASQTNRLLQLADRNALQNATLTNNATNGVSFAAGANGGGPFNIGAFAGTATLALTDTGGGAVALNIGGNNASTTFSGTFTGAGSIIKSGTGTFISAGSSSETGGVTIAGGTYQMGNGGTTGNAGQSGSTITFSGDNTRLLLNRSGNIWNYNIALGGSGTGTNTIAAVTAIPTSWSGVISGSGTQTVQFNDASNAGSITLLSNSTYSNPTTVFAGALLVNGGIGSSVVTVKNTATLGGGTPAVSGNIGGIIVQSGGTLAPGPSGGLGSLTSGSTSLAAGATFALDINSTTFGADLLLTSDLSLAAANGTKLTVTDLSPAAISSGTFTFISYGFGSWNGGLFNIGGVPITDYDAVTNPNSTIFSVAGNFFQLDYDAGGTNVTLMAVPEPATAATLLGGLGLLLARRRRKR